MRLETIPLIVGVIVCLIGLAIVFDAWTPDDVIVKRERRRRPRLERSRGGEAAIGLGIICMGAAFLGRDTWRYSVVAVIVGAVLLFLGTLRNRHYLGQAISNRGALRRRPR
jgi:multisubunit Na+/H+ antiporter MnhG subunit